MTSKYGWDRLNERGDWLVLPGLRPANVSSLVKTHILRRLGRDAVVATHSVPEGTFVVLVHAPSRAEADDGYVPESTSPASSQTSHHVVGWSRPVVREAVAEELGPDFGPIVYNEMRQGPGRVLVQGYDDAPRGSAR